MSDKRIALADALERMDAEHITTTYWSEVCQKAARLLRESVEMGLVYNAEVEALGFERGVEAAAWVCEKMAEDLAHSRFATADSALTVAAEVIRALIPKQEKP